MLQQERHNYILERLFRNRSVNVAELASLLRVSPETIRSDLRHLEAKRLLTRSHGGAVRFSAEDTTHVETPYYERESQNIESKKQIARLACSYIEKDDQIILDSSSTCIYLARELPNMPLTVLTNSARLLYELSLKDKITVFVVGGMLLTSSMCMVGRDALESLSQYHVNKAFVSCKGITQDGASESNEFAISVKIKMLRISDEAYLLGDHTKFGVQDFMQVAALDAFTAILTDADTAREQISLLGPYAQKVRPYRLE